MRYYPAFLCLALFAVNATARAQTGADAAKPYATLDRQAVTYRGPVSSAEKEPPGQPAVIGMVLPLQGTQQAEGKAFLAAAQLAIQEEQARGILPDGRRLDLVVRDESGQWGQASTEILKLFDQNQALAIVTSSNGTSAHLAEQIATKLSIPILTLSSDPSTTETNVPWLFRLGPSDIDQARAFCQRIYASKDGIAFGSAPARQRVLLIAQTDHDGRTGAAEFEKIAKRFGAVPPTRFELDNSPQSLRTLQDLLRTTELDAVVVWTDAPSADAVLSLIRSSRPSAPVFLSRKAAQLNAVFGRPALSSQFAQAPTNRALFTVDAPFPIASASTGTFRQRYIAQTGMTPSLAANDAYEAVRLLAAALRVTGANRVLLRDYLANQGNGQESSTSMPFDPAGNSLREFSVVQLQSTDRASTP